MLLGLVFRGVAFEFRFRSKRRQHLWDLAFAGGSLLAAFSQGVMLGTGWLILKTEGDLQQRFYAVALPLAALVVAMIGGVSLWTPFLDAAIAERCFSWPNLAIFSPVPLLVGATVLLPIILAYTGYVYWVFRGKIDPDAGYH